MLTCAIPISTFISTGLALPNRSKHDMDFWCVLDRDYSHELIQVYYVTIMSEDAIILL